MNKNIKNILIVFGVPTVYAIIVRLFFGVSEWNDLFEVMSVTFLFCLPTIVGGLTVFLAPQEMVSRKTHQILISWIPIFLFFIITLVFKIEGWACWMMILPIFLIAASIGGLIGGSLKLKRLNNRLNSSFILLIPFLLAPFENLINQHPSTYEAYTYIDINADATAIWDNVTKVGEITEDEDSGWLNKLLGFPRPITAELDFEGIGAYRKAIFTNGLVFHETVTEYEDNKLMVFDIKAYPHEIPSTTLDEHVVIGGDYFDVISGKYELEYLGNGIHRLHLSSMFEMKTTFNFYAGWWGKMIMKDIQNNILKIEKKRAELI